MDWISDEEEENSSVEQNDREPVAANLEQTKREESEKKKANSFWGGKTSDAKGSTSFLLENFDAIVHKEAKKKLIEQHFVLCNAASDLFSLMVYNAAKKELENGEAELFESGKMLLPNNNHAENGTENS